MEDGFGECNNLSSVLNNITQDLGTGECNHRSALQKDVNLPLVLLSTLVYICHLIPNNICRRHYVITALSEYYLLYNVT